MFSWKNIFHGLLFPFLDYKMVGKRYLKFHFDIRELLYKLRIGKETNGQDRIYAS